MSNGLRLIHYQDSATKMVALNLLYNVGSKHESPGRTGLAHLMEHLMFGGSAHVPNYDDTLQAAGGSSNAWTNVDMTNYYESLPAHNIETAMWVESDRLLALNLNKESIRVQKDVVMEEFKQRYLNAPYGDLGHIMHSLAYTAHPYQWPTIGKDLSHIEEVTDDEIVEFYHKHYAVDNLIMCIAGNIEFGKAVELAEKWFGDIKPMCVARPVLQQEPTQTAGRSIVVERDVPQNMIVRMYHMPGRADSRYPACDLLSDILANGKSSRFYQRIMSQTDVFTDLDAAVEGTVEPGLFLVRGRLNDGFSYQQADDIIDRELNNLITEGVTQHELDKCVNKFHAAALFDNIGYQEKATKLCECELLGDAGMVNTEVDRYRATSVGDVLEISRTLLDASNCCTVCYSKKN